MKIKPNPKTLLEAAWKADRKQFPPDAKTPSLCLRCGKPLNPCLAVNALSRHADVYICESCGTEEALQDYTGCPPHLESWHAFKVIRKYRIQCEDPVVDLSSPFMRQYEDFLVTVDRFAAGRLAGSIARILLGGGDYVLRALDWNGSVCCIRFHVDWPRADLNAVEDKYEMAPAEDADIGTAGFNPPASDTGE